MTGTVCIAGAGAIGGTIAGYLTRSGIDVAVVDPWHANVEAIRRNGLRVKSPEGELLVRPRAYHVDELRDLGEPIETAVIAVKSYDTEWLTRAVAPYLADDALVVSAQNGINEDTIRSIVGASRTVGAVVHIAAALLEPAGVTRFSSERWVSLIIGEVEPGALPPARLSALQELLMPMGSVLTSENIFGDLWSKLSLNCMANGLSGVTGVSTPTLFRDPEARMLMTRIGAEAVAVSRAARVTMGPLEPTGAPGTLDPALLLAAGTGDAAAFAQLSDFLIATADARSGPRENRSSLLQDVTKGRRSEIDYLNGYIVRKGTDLSIPTPANAAIIRAVKQLEAGTIRQDAGNLREILSAAG
jgi:2-dehydropantoate 2-reductase